MENIFENNQFETKPDVACFNCENNIADNTNSDLQKIVDMYYTKRQRRKKNMKDFEEYMLPDLEDQYEVVSHNNESGYSIRGTEFGTVDIYPMSDKVLIRKDNKWLKNGLKWIGEHL